MFAAMTPEPPAVQPIEDGDVLPVLGGLRVVHTPGHTPGSVCLYGARDRVLFVGDNLQRRFGRLSFASRLYSDDYALARRSMAPPDSPSTSTPSSSATTPPIERRRGRGPRRGSSDGTH